MSENTDEENSTRWEDLVVVGQYPTFAKAQEHGLVILAMRYACWVEQREDSGDFLLHAEPANLASIAREIREYEEEQLQPVRPVVTGPDLFRHGSGWGVYALWMSCLVLAFGWQNANPDLVERFSSSSTGLIGRGEWWRPFTALFLHADAAHLTGNLLSGMLFGTLVAQSLGAWRAWALILASGAIGNTLTSALTWPESFVSIGASTAVFGALGILSGLAFATMLRTRLQVPWAKTAAPVIGGIILLGWLGGGSPSGNTDVLGHVFGFGSGLAAGCIVGRLSPAAADASTAGTSRAAHGGLT